MLLAFRDRIIAFHERHPKRSLHDSFPFRFDLEFWRSKLNHDCVSIFLARVCSNCGTHDHLPLFFEKRVIYFKAFK